jgi:hypothetical protein
MSQLAKLAESSTFLCQAEDIGQKEQPTGLWSLARLYPSFLPKFNVYGWLRKRNQRASKE